MTGRSTSWFDRDELKALFKGVRPARSAEPASEAEEPAKPQVLPPPVAESVLESPPPSPAPPEPAAEASFEPPLAQPTLPLPPPPPPESPD